MRHLLSYQNCAAERDGFILQGGQAGDRMVDHPHPPLMPPSLETSATAFGVCAGRARFLTNWRTASFRDLIRTVLPEEEITLLLEIADGHSRAENGL
jgi:hypothetical protein